jgi:hypothetical protein
MFQGYTEKTLRFVQPEFKKKEIIVFPKEGKDFTKNKRS